jgi:BirA family biotin operon repressor/biotin-[acetyl-CoA-carboxylase] ligase
LKTELSFDTHRIQAEILEAVLNSKHRRLSFLDIEKKTGIIVAEVKETARELTDSGVGFAGRKYYRVPELPDLILPPVILAGLRSSVMGRRIFAYKSIGSTNDSAKRLAESDSPEGTMIIAEKQTKGRGRLGRSWQSPQNKGLYFSLILRPRVAVGNMPALSLVAALSVCRVIENITALEPLIKWPNDCLIGGKKVAGILIDISAELGRISYAVLGVGLNINMAVRDFSSEIRKKATSLAMETGEKFSRKEILREFLAEFEKSYRKFCRYGLSSIASELVKRSSVIGHEIGFKLDGRKFAGIALGYDELGGLRVKTKDGVKVLAAGEVTLRK